MEIEAEQAGEGDPEQYDTSRLQGLRFHLLAADPKLGCGGRGDLGWRIAVVDRKLGMQSKEKHQGA
jgi:hypothetical protein